MQILFLFMLFLLYSRGMGAFDDAGQNTLVIFFITREFDFIFNDNEHEK